VSCDLHSSFGILFVISSPKPVIAAFIDIRRFRPARSVCLEHACPAAGGGGQARPARMPPMRWRCAGCRKAWRCATGASRDRSARKATTSACGCWSGGVRRWSRPTMSAATMSPNWRNARLPWRASLPTTNMSGLADPALLAREFPDLDLLDPVTPIDRRARAPRHRGGSRGTCGEGRDQIRRRLGLDRDRRHGAGDLYRLSWLLSALEPGHIGDSDRWRRHRHGA